MTIYYSDTTKGFYDTEVIKYPALPGDIVEITEEEHKTFLHALNVDNKEIVIKSGKLTLQPRVQVWTWDMIRNKRNRLLSACDHTQTPDWPGDGESWKAYRQELRDITDKFKDPNKVVWPTPPNS